MRIVVVLLASLGVARSDAVARTGRAPAHPAAGEEQFARGDFEQAIEEWMAAAKSARKTHDSPTLIDALTELGAAYQAIGEHRLAVDAVDEAVALARSTHDRGGLRASLCALGAICTFSRETTSAETSLREALDLARAERDPEAIASVLNNFGNLLSAQEKFPEALAAYREAIPLAEKADQATLAAKLRVNLAQTAVISGGFDQAPVLNQAAIQSAERLTDSHDKTFALLRAGRTWELLFDRAPAHEQRLRRDALQVYEQAAAVAEKIKDTRALSYALGYAGHLYEQEKKYPEALRLTRRAAFLAQEKQSRDALYQWEWQTARIDKAAGRRDEAIAGYRRAIRDLNQIRTDLSIRLGNPNTRSSFREAVGDIFFELADLLLQRADGLRDDAAVAECLREARDTCEQLKSVELEDYFQDDCVNLIQSKKKTIEGVSPTAAVIYLIPLPDRTEMIVSIASGLQRVRTAVGAAQLTAAVRDFRIHLETRTTNQYLSEAWQLYDWLIRPVEPLLARNRIDTLVFVPDGALRTIPMAALHDGERFLIEKFAIAVTPGLTLMEPKPIKRVNVAMMASGLSQSVERDGATFPALPFVEKEIADLNKLYGGRALMNRDFRTEAVQREFKAQQYSVVHIASHGEFSGDVKKTFVLTYDDRLSLDALEKLIRPSQLRDQPVELLSLSACQTAAGDDRAALGLAGIAVKAGARSAFATLWFVNDEASTHLIADFYATLHNEPDFSKAKALQRAQMHLLSDPRYSHPCLWAPYMIIGNWL